MKTTRLVIKLLILGLLSTSWPARAEEAKTIRVLQFNVWGIFSSKDKSFRMSENAKAIAALDPDIIALEEAFDRKSRKQIVEGLKAAGYPIGGWHYWHKPYGSGVMLITKHPIESLAFEKYRVQCPPTNMEHYAGKGMAHAVLKTPHGPLDFYLTHVLSRTPAIFDEQGEFIPGDPFQVDRILQMYQIDQYVHQTRNPMGRSFIAAGDWNVSPEMLEFHVLLKLTGFENSFDLLHPGDNPSTFSKNDTWVIDDFSRIDHIFFKNFPGDQGFWVKPIESRVVFKEKVKDPKGKEVNLSDHYGLLTVFEVVDQAEPSPNRTPAPEAIQQAYEKKDRRSKEVIPAAEKLVKE
jgi:endonuclease/exonuclease/phosphatase family metal-dependent hydrolase